jgi:hypothetical protein
MLLYTWANFAMEMLLALSMVWLVTMILQVFYEKELLQQE